MNFGKFSFEFLPITQQKMNSNNGFLASFWYLQIQNLKSFQGLYTGPTWGSNPPPPPPPHMTEAMNYSHCISCQYQKLSNSSKGGITKSDPSSRGETKLWETVRGIRENGVLIYKILPPPPPPPPQVTHNECSLMKDGLRENRDTEVNC